jgi:hypothetical protein
MSYKETYKETYKDAYNEAYYYYNMIANVHGKIGQRGRHVWGFGVNRALAYTHTHTHTHTHRTETERREDAMMREFSGAKEKMIKSIPTQVRKVIKRKKCKKKMKKSKKDQKH